MKVKIIDSNDMSEFRLATCSILSLYVVLITLFYYISFIAWYPIPVELIRATIPCLFLPFIIFEIK